jgi:hypothetical protein
MFQFKNVSTIHNLFDLIIFVKKATSEKIDGKREEDTLKKRKKSAVCYLGREKYLIKWITMDETCNTRKYEKKMN